MSELAEGLSAAERAVRRRARVIATAARMERRLYDLESKTLRTLAGDLDAARKEIVAKLASVSKDAWQRAQLETVLTELERQMTLWNHSATSGLSASLVAAHEHGNLAAIESLRAGGITMAAGPSVSTAYLAAAYQSSALLIGDVTEEVIRKVDSELRRAALLGQTPWDVMQRLGPITGKGRFATAFHRAEAITRTEMGRVASVANHSTLSEMAKTSKGLGREWMAALDARTRPDHAAANGQRRAIDQPFDVGGEQLMYPRDPRASAAQVVNCRCYEIPWHADWEKTVAQLDAETAALTPVAAA